MPVQPIQIRYEGIREVAQALRETDRDLLKMLKEELEKVGDVVRDDAHMRFTGGAARDYWFQRSAANFETRVRATGKAQAIVVVGQGLRKTTGLHPEWGGLQMTRALLPARADKEEAAAQILEDGAVRLLREHGIKTI